MEIEYRIKEVKIPLKSGEVVVFYPQIKQEMTKKTGMFWWAKYTSNEVWCYFHKTGESIYIDYDGSRTHIYCDKIEDAEKLIEDYKVQANKRAKKYWIEKSADWEDDRYVKYHELKQNDNEPKKEKTKDSKEAE